MREVLVTDSRGVRGRGVLSEGNTGDGRKGGLMAEQEPNVQRDIVNILRSVISCV